MNRTITSGVVLSTREIGESDLIVEFFTERFGRFTGVAKGAKKSKRRFVNAFDLATVLLIKTYRPRGRELFIIEDASILDTHQAISRGIAPLAFASLVLELVREFSPAEEENPRLFSIVCGYLTLLENRGPKQDLLWVFVLKILKELGISPLFGSCARCGKKAKPKTSGLFVPKSGGFVCGECLDVTDRGMPLSQGSLFTLDHIIATPADRLPRITLTQNSVIEVRAALTAFIRYHAGRRLKSLDFIERYI